MPWYAWIGSLWPAVSLGAGIVIGKSIKLADVKAERKRQIHMATELIDEAEKAESTLFMQGYVMGACTMAGTFDAPPEVWASPQRHIRRSADSS